MDSPFSTADDGGVYIRLLLYEHQRLPSDSRKHGWHSSGCHAERHWSHGFRAQAGTHNDAHHPICCQAPNQPINLLHRPPIALTTTRPTDHCNPDTANHPPLLIYTPPPTPIERQKWFWNRWRMVVPQSGAERRGLMQPECSHNGFVLVFSPSTETITNICFLIRCTKFGFFCKKVCLCLGSECSSLIKLTPNTNLKNACSLRLPPTCNHHKEIHIWFLIHNLV